MMFLPFLITLLVLATQPVEALDHVAISTGTDRVNQPSLRHSRQREDILCNLFFAITSYQHDKHDDLQVLCDLQNLSKEEGLEINLEPAFVLDHSEDIKSRSLQIRIDGGKVIRQEIPGFGSIATSIDITQGANVFIEKPSTMNERRHLRAPSSTESSSQPRQLQHATGVRKVLLFRVTTDDETAAVTPTEMADAVVAADRYSVMTQYESCSHNKLSFELYDSANPVTEIRVTGNTADFSPHSLRNAATTQANAMFGTNGLGELADHAIFCLPGPGSFATASFNGLWIMARSGHCSNPRVLLHELGHNIGLGHAGDAEFGYGDGTSLMGADSFVSREVYKCFNGQNLYRLGWFSDRFIEVVPTLGGAFKLDLATYVDYEKTVDEVVVIKILDLFMVYNRAKDFNADQTEHIDTVTIVQEQGHHSFLLAGIDMTDSVYVHPSNDSTPDLVIEVCGQTDGDSFTPDSFSVAIGYDSSPCTSSMASNQAPSSVPTSGDAPTSAPTLDLAKPDHGSLATVFCSSFSSFCQ